MSKQEHKYAQAFRWLADGETVLGRCTGREVEQQWIRLPDDFGSTHLAFIHRGDDGYEFRLAPRTVKVGDVEFEAPLSECAHGQVFYFTSFDGQTVCAQFHDEDFLLDARLLKEGRAFASKEACEAANAAWVKLMTGAA